MLKVRGRVVPEEPLTKPVPLALGACHVDPSVVSAKATPTLRLVPVAGSIGDSPEYWKVACTTYGLRLSFEAQSETK